MGCISSKLMPRSMSLKEELSQRMQDRNDKFLTLVYTANTIAPKLGSDKNPKPESLADHNTLMINFNTWEFLSNVEQGGDTSTSSTTTPSISKRSRSFHCYREYDNLQNSQELNYRSVGRARSFHTVKEFDTIMLRKTSFSEMKLQLKDETWVQETPPLSSSQVPQELTAEEESPQQGNDLENVSKRKMVAKGPDPLEIPHTIEFCTVVSLREWIQSGGVASANHVTPKFSSYNLPSSGTKASGCDDSVVFNPELVTAFDERMQQLEAEAESILQQISGADRDKD